MTFAPNHWGWYLPPPPLPPGNPGSATLCVTVDRDLGIDNKLIDSLTMNHCTGQIKLKVLTTLLLQFKGF